MSPTLRTTLARSLAVASALLVCGTLALTPAWSAPTNPDQVRTDRVQTTLEWVPCGKNGIECATVALPLDYDQPNGPTVKVFLAKHRATDPEPIGTLFVNPGGPGAPGSTMAIDADLLFSEELLARFDIVGMDPRGVGSSTKVVCGSSTKKQTQDMRGLSTSIPLTASEQAHYLNSAKKQAMNCSKIGAPLSASMSTAQVARDMNVLRRLVGDDGLTYFGQSYGSYLGQVYANMFPDRVRAVALDGVLDPEAWAGTPATSKEPVSLRVGSAEGSHAALQASFEVCAAQDSFCVLGPDLRPTFTSVAAKLKAAPVVIQSPNGPFQIDYGTFIGSVLAALYSPAAPYIVDLVVAGYAEAVDPALAPAAAYAAVTEADATVRQAVDKLPPHSMEGYPELWQPRDAFDTVVCTDSLNSAAPKDWAPAIAARAKNAPHFADAWGWQSATCADRFWTAKDEDAWRGPFTNRTSAPVLMVANTYDPATPYSGAVAAASLAPNRALLTVETFGHMSYGMQPCATAMIDDYLLNGTVPAEDLTCEAG